MSYSNKGGAMADPEIFAKTFESFKLKCQILVTRDYDNGNHCVKFAVAVGRANQTIKCSFDDEKTADDAFGYVTLEMAEEQALEIIEAVGMFA